MTKIEGPFEAIGALAFAIGGLYMGYNLGSEAVEYAKTIAENPDVLGYVVNQHPVITKVVTTVGVGNLMGELGKLPGSTLDGIFGTKYFD